MIKKYIGISLIAASLAFVGCSSDDDGDSGGNSGMEGDNGDMTPTVDPIVVPPEVTIPEGVTPPTMNIVDTAQSITDANSMDGATGPTFSTLLSVASADPEVLALLTSEDADHTVFAPTDEALDAAIALLGGAPDAATVNSILKLHVVAGALDAAGVVAGIGNSVASVGGGNLSFTGEAGANPQVNGVEIIDTDNYATNGIIHVINGVIQPLPEPTPDEEPVTPAVEGEDGDAGQGGPSIAAIREAGHTDYIALYNIAGFGTSFDSNTWTGVIPTNDAIDDGLLEADPDAITEIIKDHVYSDGALTPAMMLELGSVTANGGATMTFGGTEDAITINGFPATAIVVPGAASTLYVIGGLIESE